MPPGIIIHTKKYVKSPAIKQTLMIIMCMLPAKKVRANIITDAIIRLAIAGLAMALKKAAIDTGVRRKQYHNEGNRTR